MAEPCMALIMQYIEIGFARLRRVRERGERPTERTPRQQNHRDLT